MEFQGGNNLVDDAKPRAGGDGTSFGMVRSESAKTEG